MSTSDERDTTDEQERSVQFAHIEFDAPEYDERIHGVIDTDYWIESPEHYDVFFLADQGINYGLADMTASFADALRDLDFVFGVTWSTEMERPYWVDIRYDENVILIDMSQETAVWNFEVVFQEIAVDILLELDAADEYSGPMPVERVEQYIGERMPKPGEV